MSSISSKLVTKRGNALKREQVINFKEIGDKKRGNALKRKQVINFSEIGDIWTERNGKKWH